MKMPLEDTIVGWLKSYCQDIKIIDREIYFTFNDIHMHMIVDIFSNSARIVGEVFDCAKNEGGKEECLYSGFELVNVMNQNMYPYSFSYDELDGIIQARKTFTISLTSGLEFVLKVEIYRMFYLCQQVEKVYYMNRVSDLPDDEGWMQFLLSVVDKWVAADLLDINILYLHGFASSGNSETAKEIQACLPHCKVISPDLPINPREALDVIRNVRSANRIDIVIGTSMGALLSLFTDCRNIIVVNPSFHVSKMMKQRLGEEESVTIPFFKKRENGETEFVLTRNIANSYFNLESNAFLQSQLNPSDILGIFGTDDDVVVCKNEFLTHSLNIRYFKGGHRLNKEAVEEVVVPSILQMIINNNLK